jgi:putative transposase
MADYHHSAHAVWDIKHHLVWITKYRYKILRGEVAERARELLRQIAAAREVKIVRGAVSPDHVHMLVVVPPQLAPAKLVQFLKGRSSRMLQAEFAHLRKRYWGQHLWARGDFCATVGAVDEWGGDGLYREPAVGRGRGWVQSDRAHRALSRLSAGGLQAASAAARLSVGTGVYRL